MSQPVALTILILLLVGPIAWRRIQRNIEGYFLIVGLLSGALAGVLDVRVIKRAVSEPIPITVMVMFAGACFGTLRGRMDAVFERARARMRIGALAALAVFVVAVLSSVITAVVAALLLVEAVEMMRLEPGPRVNVTVAGCLAIGICSALTPLGGPLSTLAAGSLGLGFWGLLRLLGSYAIPGAVACSIVAGLLAGHESGSDARLVPHVRETLSGATLHGVRIFAFVSGLVLIAEAFAPAADRLINLLDDRALFWANAVSALLDNSTLVALEVHHMSPGRARAAIIALLVSGGMLIPGNVPNLIAAGVMKIGSAEWARVGVPLGLALMCIYFAFLYGLG